MLGAHLPQRALALGDLVIELVDQRQRGPSIARVDIARKLTEAIWHMLTTNKPFAPAGAALSLAPVEGPRLRCDTGAKPLPSHLVPPPRRR